MKNRIAIIIIVIVALGVIGALGYVLYDTQNQIKQKDEDLKSATEMIEFERQQTENELRELALEVEGYSYDIVGNDSLVKLLDTQKQKIQALLQELKTVKATNAKRISELKGELGTVRLVLMDYIRRVDSLNKINQQLVITNENVTQQYQQAARTASELAVEKVALSEKVNRAATLEADIYSIQTLNKSNKVTSRVSRIAKIAVYFTVEKNVTAEVGAKTFYARIVKPSNEVLAKSPANTFPFENRNILYSMKKTIEYKGERVKDVIYYDVEETLLEGTYRVDLFADGRVVGHGEFIVD